jgi:hypothetical protein
VSAEAQDALRLLGGLIAADLRAGSPVLAKPTPPAQAERRRPGRPKSIPYAVVAAPLARAA